MKCDFCKKEIVNKKGTKIETRRQYVLGIGKAMGFFSNIPERNYHSNCLDIHLSKEDKFFKIFFWIIGSIIVIFLLSVLVLFLWN